jgi:hypothetical protein
MSVSSATSAGLPVAEHHDNEEESMPLREREPALFKLARSVSDGAPAEYENADSASRASWKAQGKMFQRGTPVQGNSHVREFRFRDGSKVIISAHEPKLDRSDFAKFKQAMVVAGGALAGGFAGAIGGPVTTAIGAVTAGSGSIEAAGLVPYDRISQIYTADFFAKDSRTPFKSEGSYVWDGDRHRVELLAAQPDSSQCPDYADGDPDGSWDFWTLHSGNSPVRT